jgi:hypothetical protein
MAFFFPPDEVPCKSLCFECQNVFSNFDFYIVALSTNDQVVLSFKIYQKMPQILLYHSNLGLMLNITINLLILIPIPFSIFCSFYPSSFYHFEMKVIDNLNQVIIKLYYLVLLSLLEVIKPEHFKDSFINLANFNK